MTWQKDLLSLITKSKDEKMAVAVDTSTNEYPVETIRNILSLFNEVQKKTPLIFADYKIREITDTAKVTEIPLMSHGKASYTDTLEWAKEQKIDKLFYITDVTGYFWEGLEINYDVIWLIPDKFKPQVPFGKSLNLVRQSNKK
ncbi:VWA-like domain-containing protein [Aquibacillus koreensis]|uniref:VWA-like domain-containing protein n=1 Tax=Aquibacillus koreensis TaxID=279446 RepID=A0A9X3WKR9_9BACI|nr:VWA-like domain-containing protein [Aquibacillus koreensis]MCT2536952.1 VWA-like domain-containing protein [Aquibacillus koreensis]MDC3421917.1 VWA-like domain-containing protein [Aquibacillus koreensis]